MQLEREKCTGAASGNHIQYHRLSLVMQVNYRIVVLRFILNTSRIYQSNNNSFHRWYALHVYSGEKNLCFKTISVVIITALSLRLLIVPQKSCIEIIIIYFILHSPRLFLHYIVSNGKPV